MQRAAVVRCAILFVKALLHAISKGHLDIVRSIIEHPNYWSAKTEQQKSPTDTSKATFHAEENYQYSPDITPLMLAAHMYVSACSVSYYTDRH